MQSIPPTIFCLWCCTILDLSELLDLPGLRTLCVFVVGWTVGGMLLGVRKRVPVPVAYRFITGFIICSGEKGAH